MKTEYIEKLPEHWQPIAEIFSALGDANRQRILLLFEPEEELSIKEIAEQFHLGRTTIVHHLAALERAGILSMRREGKLALYSARPEIILEAIEKLRVYIVEDLIGKGDEA